MEKHKLVAPASNIQEVIKCLFVLKLTDYPQFTGGSLKKLYICKNVKYSAK